MSEDHTIREAALHAFVDNELDVEAGREVETWLRQHPDKLQEIANWKDQKKQLKAAYDPILDETIPKDIQEVLNRSGRPPKSVVIPWRNIAAGIALLVIGLGTGWYTGQPKEQKVVQTKPKKWPVFAQNAISSHLVFTSDDSRPVEFAAPQKNYLLAWVDDRMKKRLTPPALRENGFKFLGGRVLPHNDKPAVFFMYESIEGKRLTILVGQNQKPSERPKTVWTKKGLHCFFWFKGQFSFAVTSDIDKSKLENITKTVENHFLKI